MPNRRSGLLNHLYNERIANNDSNFVFNSDYTNFISVINGDNIVNECDPKDNCNKPNKNQIVKNVSNNNQEDYTISKKHLEIHRNSSGCCKPFPYDPNFSLSFS